MTPTPLPKMCVFTMILLHKLLYPVLQAPNRVGNIPMHWYDDLPHVGYDVNGKKVLRPARGDELDKFLETVEDPSSWLEFCSLIHLIIDFRTGRTPLTAIPSRKNLSQQGSWISSAACAKTKFLIRISIPTRYSLRTKSLRSCLLAALQNPSEDGFQVNGRNKRYAAHCLK